MKKLEDSKFSYSIISLEVMKQEKNIWDQLKTNSVFNQKVISVQEKIIYIPIDKKLAKN